MSLVPQPLMIACLIALPCVASADDVYTHIVVHNYSGGTCSGGIAWDHIYTGLSPITLELNACAEKVEIFSCSDLDGNDPGIATDMPKVTLTGGPVSLGVLITLGVALPSATEATPVGANWGGLDARNLSTSRLYGAIRGDLTGPINVDEIFRFDAGGTIQSEVRAGGAGYGSDFIVGAASITGSVVLETNSITLVDVGTLAGRIEATAGSISKVEVSGDMTSSGTVEAIAGSIGELTVHGNAAGRILAKLGAFGNITIDGALSTQDDPGGIWPIRSLNGINKLIAGSISANMTFMHGGSANGGSGKVGLIKTTNGSISKNIALKELVTPTGGNQESGIIINGSFPSTASVRFLSGAAHAKNIFVRDSFAGEIRYDHPATFDTQIVVNAGNAGGVWSNTGTVVLNSNPPSGVTPVTLSTTETNLLYQGPLYRATPAQLGGGSIGVVPFTLHDYASAPINPASGTSPTSINLDTGSVVLEFYGPVKAESQTESPVEIEYVGTNSDDPDAALWFTAVVSGRTLTLTRIPCIPPGTYTVTPVLTGTNRLLCDVPGFASPPVADFSYRFAVSSGGVDCGDCPTCAADFDNNGGVDGGDIGAFFAAFETGSTCADVDENGGVDGGDLAAFFLLFEAGGC